MTSSAGSPSGLLRAAAAHGLPGAAPLPRRTAGDLPWGDVIALAERQRVLGLLAAAVADDPDVDLAPAERVALAEAHEGWCVHDLRLERQLLQAAELLDEAGIPFVTFKGPALAHGWYADPAWRLFADLDLLVPGARLADAVAVLGAGLGAGAVLPELRTGFDERFGKESLLVTAPTPTSPLGFEIDVHRTLVAGALGLAIPLDELFDDRGSFVLGDRSIPTLGVVPTFLAACYQATIADVPPRLAAARDVVQLVRSARFDLDATLAAATRWQARAVMAEAVTWAWRTLAVAERPDVVLWAERYRPTRRERWLLDSHRTTGYVYWRQLAAVAVLPGIEPRARYLQATLAPQASYLERRRWTFANHVRTALRALSRPVREPVVRGVRRFRRRYWPPA